MQQSTGRPTRSRSWGAGGARHLARAIGKGLIALGVVLLLFVSYQLWGTGIAERSAQSSLRSDFEQQLLNSPPTSAPMPQQVVPTTTPPPDLGEAVARIQIPRIDLEKFVVEGVGVEDLKKGPGHYPGTVMPGEIGNAAIAGHRTTYGAPFGRLDELDVGDPIVVSTRSGEFTYEVIESKVVSPEDVWVLDPTPDGRLTLTTCHPRYSAAQRLIIVAALKTPVQTSAAEKPPPAAVGPSQASGQMGAQLPGLSGNSASTRPALAWGIAAGAVWLAAWWMGRRSRRWLVYVLATPVFLVLLFGFFENVAAFLPANA